MGYQPGLPWKMFLRHAEPFFSAVDMEVLEVGPGRLSKSLVRKFCLERHYDYSFVDRQNYGDDQPGYIAMDGDSIFETDSNQFDAVVLYEMLHNVRRPWKLIPEVARVTKPGGIVVIEDVLSYPEFNRHPVDFGRIFPDGLNVLFADSGLAPLIAIAGNEEDLAMRPRGRFDPGKMTHVVAVGRKP